MLRKSSIDSESKQRFSRRIHSGQLLESLKCPKTVEFRSVLILKLDRGKLALMVWGC